MAQRTLLKARGLYTFPNDISSDPEGALSEAQNIVIDRNDIIEPRRGFSQFGSTFSATSTDRANQLFEYKERILAQYENKLAYDSNGSGSFSDFSGTYQSASNTRMKGIEVNGNFYFTTSDGVKKLSAASSSSLATADIINAGGVKALNITGDLNAAAGGFLAPNEKVGYRVVWGYNDDNENLILGTPSSRFVIENTSGSNKDIDLTFPIPDEIVNSPLQDRFFYQVYRTALFTTSDPDEEYFLVFEDFPTFPGTSVSLTDQQPDDLRAGGALLYINAVSGEGIENANEKPPLAKDVALFNGYTFYANTATVQRLIITQLSGDSSLNTGTITFDDGVNTPQTYTFVLSSSSDTEVEYSSAGTVAQQIDEATRNLVNAINTNPNEDTVYAYYISGAEDLPGQILLEHRDIAGTQFTVTTSGLSGKFDPNLESGVTSSNEDRPNRIYYSKFQQPEAVPLINFIDVGPRDEEILRIVPLRDSLFIFKEESLYRLTGEVAPFQLAEFDSAARLLAPDSAQVLNNQIFCFTTQGVATVTDTSVQIISRPIEDVLLRITRDGYNFETASFGLVSESDRAYHLWLPSTATDTVATQCYRFNTFTRTWTRWTKATRCGVVNRATDKIYLGPTDENFIEQERKNRDRTDHADRDFIRVIQADGVNDTNIVVNSLTNMNPGYAIVQNQFLTINQYNQLLGKLDLDVGVADTDYSSTLTLLPGANTQTAITDLTNKLDSDSGVSDSDYNSLHGSPSTNQDSQTEFNSILSKLDSDSGTTFSNYSAQLNSSGTVEYESVILDTDNDTSSIIISIAQPFIEANLTVFEAIDTRTTYSADPMGDVSILKHAREATVIVENNNFTTAKVGFSADNSPGFETIEFNRSGKGDWGQFVYGDQNWGGLSGAPPMRTYIPRAKQRCRFIRVRFEHMVAREKFSLYGYSLTLRNVSTRGYR